jgi:GWxTD domain-containing protein
MPPSPARALVLSLLLASVCRSPCAAQAPEGGDPAPPETASAATESAPFLLEVEPLISPAERQAYLALTRPYQRQAFERRFWELRDPYPETPRNELEERFRERLRLARERYPAPGDERFRMTLLLGEPIRRIPLRCAEILRPGEVWYLAPSDRIPQGFALAFVSRGVSADAPHRLWSPKSGYGELLTWSTPAAGDLAAEVADRVPRDCPRGDEIVGALAAAADWSDLERRYEVVPHPNPEWVRTFLSSSTDLPADALPLAAEVEIGFPGRNQSRTIVDASVIVEAAALRAEGGAAAAGTTPPAPDASDGAPSEGVRQDMPKPSVMPETPPSEGHRPPSSDASVPSSSGE